MPDSGASSKRVAPGDVIQESRLLHWLGFGFMSMTLANLVRLAGGWGLEGEPGWLMPPALLVFLSVVLPLVDRLLAPYTRSPVWTLELRWTRRGSLALASLALALLSWGVCSLFFSPVDGLPKIAHWYEPALILDLSLMMIAARHVKRAPGRRETARSKAALQAPASRRGS